MATRNLTLVVVPGTGARSISVDTTMTVADFVCRENLHGRDIIINGVGINPQSWNTTNLENAVEVFATGSVKGNVDRTVNLVVVPGTGARHTTISSGMTVADLVCRENLHGRDIIVNGVAVSPSQWNTVTLNDAVEIFATGSVKGNTSRTATLVVVPGSGARQVQIDRETTVADFVCRENLHGRDIIVNGVGIPANIWSTSYLNDAVEIFATGSVKGNSAESFINIAYGDDAQECFNELVQEAQHQYGHDPYNGTISTQQGYNVLKMHFNSRKEAECYADMNLDSVQKYHCEAVKFTENGRTGFVFYGWAAC
jgi:sulfur carrier protein ThiS